MVMKIGEKLLIIKMLGIDDRGSVVYETTDLGYIIGGYTADSWVPSFFLLKTDNLGNLEWESTIFEGSQGFNGYSFATDLVKTMDGGYAFMGEMFYDGFERIGIIKTNSSGNVEWTKFLAEENYQMSYCLDATNDGGFLIGGQENVSGLGFRPLLIKLDVDGNVENKYVGTNYPSNPQHRVMDVKETIQGDVITIWSTGHIKKFNSAFIELWSYYIENQSDMETLWKSVLQVQDGGYIGIHNNAYWDSNTNSSVPTNTIVRLEHDAYSGPTWYVSTAGSNSNNGSEESPFATIQHAIDVAVNKDTIYLYEGIYTENISWTGKAISIIGLEENVTINGTGDPENNPNSVIQFGHWNEGDGSFVADTSRISNVTLYNGYSGEYGAGGLYYGYGNIVLKNCRIKSNMGGGILVRNGFVKIDSCTIEQNISGSHPGGGINIQYSSGIITNSMIHNNIAASSGGGIEIYSGNVEILNSDIFSNYTSGGVNEGGGIDVSHGSNLLIKGSQLRSNSANKGSGLFVESNTLVNIINSNIVNNTGQSQGHIYVNSSIVNIINSISWPSTNFYGNYGTINYSYSLLENISEAGQGSNTFNQGEGIISGDPLFVATEASDYSLTFNSPCIDMGKPDLDGDGEDYTTDIDDQDPDQTRMDIGAFYFHQNQITGCTDPYAENFNADANVDDGSCTYLENGDYSLSFDGVDDEVNIVNNGLGSGNGNFSMLFKFKTTDLGQTGHLINTGDRTNTDFHIYIFQDNLYVGTYGNFANQTQIPTSTYMEGEWIDIAVVWNGVTMITYINGSLVETITPPYNATDNTMKIGEDGSTHGNFSMDELKLWNIDLNISDIQLFMSNTLSGNESGLVGYWKFNAGDGDILYDHSGNQNHGTIEGATWSSGVPEIISGCTDPYAENYNEDATIEDGSCTYPDNGDYFLSFDGIDDLVEINQSVISSSQNTFSAMFNAAESEHYDVDSGKPIYTQGASSNSYANYAVGLHSDGLYIELDGPTNNGVHKITGPINFNTWYHLTVVFDSGQISTYLNHNLESVIEVPFSTISPNNFGGYLGNRWGVENQNNGGYKWNGSIDQVSFWNLALTQEQIQNNISTEINGSEDGLVALWKFNSGSGDILYDHSGNQTHGTIVGATWEEVVSGCTDPYAENYNENATFDDGSCSSYPENGDYSLYFNGVSNNVNINTYGFPSGNNQITVSTWFYREQNIGSTGEYLLSYGDFFGQSFGLGIYGNENLFVTFDGSSFDAISNTSVTLNTWHHIAATHLGGGIVKIYLDGTLIHTDDVETPNTSLNNGKIGSYIDDSQKWNGKINKVAVWNSALDYDEIIALNNSGINFNYLINSGNYNSASNIKAYWKFNAGDGDILYDHSGNQNHGTIVGATWEEVVSGCTDPYAENYNENATFDDGSCTYLENGDYSLYFDGESDIVDFGDVLDLTGSFTFSVWANISSNDSYHGMASNRSLVAIRAI